MSDFIETGIAMAFVIMFVSIAITFQSRAIQQSGEIVQHGVSGHLEVAAGTLQVWHNPDTSGYEAYTDFGRYNRSDFDKLIGFCGDLSDYIKGFELQRDNLTLIKGESLSSVRAQCVQMNPDANVPADLLRPDIIAGLSVWSSGGEASEGVVIG